MTACMATARIGPAFHACFTERRVEMKPEDETLRAIEAAILELTNALRPVPVKDLVKNASRHFIDRYNELLEVAEKAVPDLQPFQWPKTIPSRAIEAQATYVELQGYLGTILGNVRKALGLPRYGGF